jgi:hypothetical protein
MGLHRTGEWFAATEQCGQRILAHDLEGNGNRNHLSAEIIQDLNIIFSMTRRPRAITITEM